MINLPSRRLVAQDDASIIEDSQVPRSKFVNSWTHLTTFDAGPLYPFLVDELLPGDHMAYDVQAYIRMATPLFPLFSNQRIDTHFFFVPYRLVWDNFVRMMGEQDDPSDSIDYTVPVIQDLVAAPGNIYDHMEIPLIDDLEIAAAPLRAYNLIWNQWFRDQNLQDSLSVPKTDGPDLASLYVLRYRAKSHDYFTSALPWPQKFTAPTIPMGGMAPVLGIATQTPVANPGAGGAGMRESDGTTDTYPFFHAASNAAASVMIRMSTGVAGTAYPEVFADLSAATGVAINTFRQAFMVQSLLERDARGGTRYAELVTSHFRVRNPDYRLQRAEYIGGGQTALQLTPIAQTAPTAGAPVGALGAAGTAHGTHRATYAATEHGYVIGLISVKTEIAYQQGLNKLWSRRTRYDFYWPALANLGEQAILRKEIWANGVPASDDAVFGYQERWHEYRTRQSAITAQFRSGITGTLDAWHLGQFFTGFPVLDNSFIIDNPPMDRVLAAGEEAVGQQYLADILIERVATRPIPTFGTPQLLGRF